LTAWALALAVQDQDGTDVGILHVVASSLAAARAAWRGRCISRMLVLLGWGGGGLGGGLAFCRGSRHDRWNPFAFGRDLGMGGRGRGLGRGGRGRLAVWAVFRNAGSGAHVERWRSRA